MSYVDEVYDLVVAKNPAQPEFHQAVKEVLRQNSSRSFLQRWAANIYRDIISPSRYRRENFLQKLSRYHRFPVVTTFCHIKAELSAMSGVPYRSCGIPCGR